MNYQNKKFVIDTLIKLSDSSPVNKPHTNSSYGNSKAGYDISQQEFSIWIDYINSVLDILSGYINPSVISFIKVQIGNIVSQSGMPYTIRALNIERELLRLAQDILGCY